MAVHLNIQKDQIIEFCASQSWHPVFAAQILHEACASLLISRMGPKEGMRSLANLQENFRLEMEEHPDGTWRYH